MSRCSASKPDGTPCERIVGASQTYCYAHHPDRSDDRRRNASRAARGKQSPSRELSALKDQLASLADDVLTGRVDTKVGAVVNQIVNTRLRAVEVERRVQETEVLANRVSELESLVRERWSV